MLQTEVYISLDGLTFEKVDLAKNESINMKYVYKDTSDLSKIFSPYSLSFTFPGTLHNQRIFGFVGNTKVFKTKSDNIFACKIYSNGLLNQTGKLKLTEVREEYGQVKSFTANFTTTMLSLTSRMGNDLINDLPLTPCEINWTPNIVHQSVTSVQVAPMSPGYGLTTKFYTPLMSNNRIFQVQEPDPIFLDNVKYVGGSDPTGTGCVKPSELNPAVQFRSIIDLIKKKYNLDIVMPLEAEQHYNDLYIHCNTEKIQSKERVKMLITTQFSGTNPQSVVTADLADSSIKIERTTLLGVPRLRVSFDGVNITGSTSGAWVNFSLVYKNSGLTFLSQRFDITGTDVDVYFNIENGFFQSGEIEFYIYATFGQPTTWSNFHLQELAYGHSGSSTSTPNDTSVLVGATKIDLYKSLPEIKCTDFLNSFFKTFNISVFDASPNDDKLFWLTPNDLNTPNTAYSKKVVDYTPYIVSQSVNKTLAADYNYYNFKHKTSEYRSNVDYLIARGHEFGQTTYPVVKPTVDLNEYKVETSFSILEALPIEGMLDEFTSYGFKAEAPEILVTGERRYKPNYDELTIFFACGQRSLGTGKKIGIQNTLTDGSLIVSAINSYVKTAPVHHNGFSLGFGLIQQATVRSLYYDFYRVQTERLLDPNTLIHSYRLRLPASELVLNFATTTGGASNIPDGFRLQNEIILQENRFSNIDAQIDITTGDVKINLLNF